MKITVELETDNVIDDLMDHHTKTEILEFIKRIDLRVAEADFTEELAKWALNEAVKEFILDAHSPVMHADIQNYIMSLYGQS